MLMRFKLSLLLALEGGMSLFALGDMSLFAIGDMSLFSKGDMSLLCIVDPITSILLSFISVNRLVLFLLR